MTVGKLARSWAWMAASVAAAWLGGASIARAQPAPDAKEQPAPMTRPVSLPLRTATTSHAAPARQAPSPMASEGVVNLNDANSDELERLPGIGPAKAKAIVEHRHSHPFHRVDDLTKVKGIGKKTFAKLRPYLTLTGATTLMAQPSSK